MQTSGFHNRNMKRIPLRELINRAAVLNILIDVAGNITRKCLLDDWVSIGAFARFSRSSKGLHRKSGARLELAFVEAMDQDDTAKSNGPAFASLSSSVRRNKCARRSSQPSEPCAPQLS